MAGIEFFDCNCRVGRRGIVYPGSVYQTADLVSGLKRYGIGKALVYHSLAREYHPLPGNRMLQEEIGEYPQLQPVWVLMPHHTGEFPEPSGLAQQMKAEGVKAARLFPAAGEQNFSVSEWNCGELFSMLEECRIPLMLGVNQLDWDQVYDICSRHPLLRLILTEAHYRMDRNIYPLLKKFPYLYLETVGYKVHHGIEELCRRFGADRLIFGSNMPVMAGSAAVGMISYAGISEEEKRLIAGQNLEQLLGGVTL